MSAKLAIFLEISGAMSGVLKFGQSASRLIRNELFDFGLIVPTAYNFPDRDFGRVREDFTFPISALLVQVK